MNPDLFEVKQVVKQFDVPIGTAPGADMAQHFRLRRREILGTYCRHGACAHIRDRGCIYHRTRHAGPGIHQGQHAEFRRIAKFVVVYEVSNNLYACNANGCYISTQYIEVTPESGIRPQMHSGLNDRLSPTLGRKRFFLGFNNFLCTHLERLDVAGIQVVQRQMLHRVSWIKLKSGAINYCALRGRGKSTGNWSPSNGAPSL